MNNNLQLHINNSLLEVNEELVLYLTEQIYAKKTKDRSISLTSPTKVKEFVMGQYFTEKGYKALVLDNQLQFLCIEDLQVNEFDISSTNLSSLVKTIIRENANVIILISIKPDREHSLPPSMTEVRLFQFIKEKLELFDSRSQDHVIVPDAGIFTLAEKGCI